MELVKELWSDLFQCIKGDFHDEKIQTFVRIAAGILLLIVLGQVGYSIKAGMDFGMEGFARAAGLSLLTNVVIAIFFTVIFTVGTKFSKGGK